MEGWRLWAAGPEVNAVSTCRNDIRLLALNMTSQEQERRQFPRIESAKGIPIKIGYLTENENIRRVGFRRARDFSRGGLSFDSIHDVSKNGRISIQISLNDTAQAIKQEAVVSWSRRKPSSSSFQIGVEFVEDSPRDTQLWERFVNQHIQSHG